MHIPPLPLHPSAPLSPPYTPPYPHHQVACGARHSLLTTSHGKLFTFGKCEDGRLGLGESLTNVIVPTEVTSLKTFNVDLVGV